MFSCRTRFRPSISTYTDHPVAASRLTRPSPTPPGGLTPTFEKLLIPDPTPVGTILSERTRSGRRPLVILPEPRPLPPRLDHAAGRRDGRRDVSGATGRRFTGHLRDEGVLVVGPNLTGEEAAFVKTGLYQVAEVEVSGPHPGLRWT